MAAGVTRTAIRLADGRELFYFDEQPSVERSQPDRRDLAATWTASEIRYDVLVDQWVVIAGHRQARTHLPPTTECPLCPSTPRRATEIPADDYDVVVFENRFPSLSYGVEPQPGGPPQGGAGDGLFLRRPGIGRCEVVCFTADHDTSFAHLPPERVATVLAAWTDRTSELSRRSGVEQVFVFENRGEEIGVTLSHPHGQIYAYPFVPPQMMRMIGTAERHRATRGTCLFCEVVAAEEAAKVRVVAQGAHWVAFVPHAASVLRQFFQITLPLCRPALAALATLQVNWIYNEFFWATVLMQSGDKFPITSSLNNLRGEFFTDYNLLSAGSILVAVPVLVVFFALQKQFVSGLTLGATKG